MTKFEELLVDKGLYDGVDISIEDLDEMQKLLSESLFNKYNINCFCVKCSEMRTFESVDKKVFEEHGFTILLDDPVTTRGRTSKNEETFKQYLNRRYSLSFRCTRDHNHTLLFDLLITNDQIIKIGQYPSFADVSIGDIYKYKSVLEKKFHEYKKSLGLFSHGIGIGSFVYLRRIIESLVFEKYDEVKNDLDITHDDFMKSDFKEKLEILKDYLPSVLVQNKSFYGIVSKGIHELSEEECLSMYPYIKVGIELILDDIITEKERSKKEIIFSQFVANKTGEFKKQNRS